MVKLHRFWQNNCTEKHTPTWWPSG